MSEGTRNRCHNCGKIIRYSSSARQRKYCDDACKQAAYRWRISQAPDTADFDQRVIAQIAVWEEEGYTQPLIERLMALWRGYGREALDDVEKILIYHKLWIDSLSAVYKTAERNEA